MSGQHEMKRHDKFESEISEFMRQQGFTVPKGLQYHKAWSKEEQTAFGKLTQPTSLVIRTRADRVCFNDIAAFVFDPKCSGPKYPRASIEAFPALVHHFEYETFGCECLYCCRTSEGDWGFWIQNLSSLIDGTNIHPSWPDDWNDYFQTLSSKAWNRKLDRWESGGSTDPFIFVTSTKIDWRDLVIVAKKGFAE